MEFNNDEDGIGEASTGAEMFVCPINVPEQTTPYVPLEEVSNIAPACPPP